MALDVSASGEDMVLLTPAEINRFISALKARYGGDSGRQRLHQQQQQQQQKKKPVKAVH